MNGPPHAGPGGRVIPGPGQESVWDYPRPPRLDAARRRVRVVFAGCEVASSEHALRVLETSHPPVFYIPPGDVRRALLQPSAGRSFCEWKGDARYFDVVVAGRRAVRAAWSYPAPTAAFQPIAGYLAFYAHAMDACFVGEERVRAQPGGFYGGWITDDVVGPFKGEPGSAGW